MSTIASLLSLIDPSAGPYTEDRETLGRIAHNRQLTETGLLNLAELKRKQAAEQEYLTAIQNNPALQQQLFGGSILGGLGQPPPGPASVPMMQQTTMPGQPPGAPQVVPGGQDLSRFAMQGAPQSTLASLGPQPQGQPQAPPNPLLEMAQRDPRAALMLQQQMQKQQLDQLTMQEKHLDMGVKVSEAIARQFQNVTDQASMDEARERVRLIHPQAAAQIPQFYSKEGVEAIQQRGIAMSEQAKNRHLLAQSRKLDMESALLPEMYRAMMDEEEPAPAGQPGAGGPAPTTASETSGTRARPAPAVFEPAIADANRLYPQVSPTRIKSIIAAESNFDPKAVSSAGAQGPMQLMPGTAKDMGVEDPFDITQNVRGGTRYYAQLLTKYGGDERKALAAYNWGPGNLDKVGGDVSKAPPETQAYVQKVLGGGGGSSRTTDAPPTDPRIAQLDAKIRQRTRYAQMWSLAGNESLSTRLNDDANRLTEERKRIIEENRHQQERREEIPRAVQKERELIQTKTDLERQRQAGPLLPDERRKLLTGLRTDIRAEPTFKLYQDVRNGYQNVRIGARTDSGQGDLAIINGMAKILDPNSTVMSGEARNVETAQGELERWFNSPQRFFEGDRLTPENRQRFLRLAHAMATEKLTTARGELTAVYEPLAKEGNIDFKQLLPLEDLKPLEPGPNAKKFDKLFE